MTSNKAQWWTQLTSLVCVLLFAATTHADEYWAHHVATQVDVAYGEHPSQILDVYIQGTRIGEPTYFAADTNPRPTLMWIHGGGWVAGNKASDISNLIPFLQQGWNVFTVNYRQGPQTAPQAVDDVLCAYKYIGEQLTERGQDANNIVVSGGSAGGHLALVVGLINARGEHPCKTTHPVKAVVNWFGITDIALVDEFLNETRPERNYARSWAGSAAQIAKVADAYSPMYLISDNAPPIISVHGTEDTVVPYDQSESFHSSLNTTNELVTLIGGKHSGFEHDQYVHAYERIFKFLGAL